MNGLNLFKMHVSSLGNLKSRSIYDYNEIISQKLGN